MSFHPDDDTNRPDRAEPTPETEDVADDRISVPNSTDPFEAQVKTALIASAARHLPAPDLEERVHARAASRAGQRPRWLLAAAALVAVVFIGSIVARQDTDQTVSLVPATAGPTTSIAPTTITPTPPVEVPDDNITVTSAPTTTPTTAPAADDASKVLRAGGIVGVDFGGSTSDAELAISALIGPAIGRFTDPTCSARQVITWGSFAVWDQEGTFTEWRLIGDAHLGLVMDQGVGIGSTSAELVQAYPDATVGENQVEVPVRRTVTIAAPDGNVAWTADLDARDHTVAMGSGPGSFWPEACPGRGATHLTLVAHPNGLGIVVFGTPADRGAAVMSAVYGEASGGSTTDATACGDVVTTRYGPAPFASTITAQGRFVGYRVPPYPSGQSGAAPFDDELVTTGTSIGDLRAIFGDRLEVDPMTDETGTHDLRIRAARNGEPDLVANASGPADTDTITTVGLHQSPSC